jgi:Acetoacetate decarboxylase (ADC).
VKYKGRNYLYFPFMWVDKDWALIRGWVNGYPKKVANIEITKLHPLLEKYNEIKEGVKLGGYVVRGGSVLFKMLVNLKFKVSELPIFEFGPTLTIRYFPSTGQGERSVKEFVQVIKTNSRSSDTWKGEGSIEFGKAVNDEVELLRVKEILGGYFYRSSFKIEGTKIIGESNENSESSG